MEESSSANDGYSKLENSQISFIIETINKLPEKTNKIKIFLKEFIKLQEAHGKKTLSISNGFKKETGLPLIQDVLEEQVYSILQALSFEVDFNAHINQINDLFKKLDESCKKDKLKNSTLFQTVNSNLIENNLLKIQIDKQVALHTELLMEARESQVSEKKSKTIQKSEQTLKQLIEKHNRNTKNAKKKFMDNISGVTSNSEKHIDSMKELMSCFISFQTLYLKKTLEKVELIKESIDKIDVSLLLEMNRKSKDPKERLGIELLSCDLIDIDELLIKCVSDVSKRSYEKDTKSPDDSKINRKIRKTKTSIFNSKKPQESQSKNTNSNPNSPMVAHSKSQESLTEKKSDSIQGQDKKITKKDSFDFSSNESGDSHYKNEADKESSDDEIKLNFTIKPAENLEPLKDNDLEFFAKKLIVGDIGKAAAPGARRVTVMNQTLKGSIGAVDFKEKENNKRISLDPFSTDVSKTVNFSNLTEIFSTTIPEKSHGYQEGIGIENLMPKRKGTDILYLNQPQNNIFDLITNFGGTNSLTQPQKHLSNEETLIKEAQKPVGQDSIQFQPKIENINNTCPTENTLSSISLEIAVPQFKNSLDNKKNHNENDFFHKLIKNSQGTLNDDSQEKNDPTSLSNINFSKSCEIPRTNIMSFAPQVGPKIGLAFVFNETIIYKREAMGKISNSIIGSCFLSIKKADVENIGFISLDTLILNINNISREQVFSMEKSQSFVGEAMNQLNLDQRKYKIFVSDYLKTMQEQKEKECTTSFITTEIAQYKIDFSVTDLPLIEFECTSIPEGSSNINIKLNLKINFFKKWEKLTSDPFSSGLTGGEVDTKFLDVKIVLSLELLDAETMIKPLYYLGENCQFFSDKKWLIWSIPELDIRKTGKMITLGAKLTGNNIKMNDPTLVTKNRVSIRFICNNGFFTPKDVSFEEQNNFFLKAIKSKLVAKSYIVEF